MQNATFDELRRELGFSLTDIADLCGVSRSTVTRWRNNPPPLLLRHLRLLLAVRQGVASMQKWG